MQEELYFGIWLRKQRRALDLTRRAFVKQVGCAEVTLRHIEAGILKPSKELAGILLEKLGIPEAERPQWISFARGLSGFPLSSLPPSTKPITNLPAPLTTFIGREKEQADVIRLINKHRLVTLTGSGGIGKTRLSLGIGEQVLQDYPDGVWLVELAPILDPLLVPRTTAIAVGLRHETQRPVIDMLLDYLHEKKMLLILDNCEHLLDACAQLADTLLKHCSRLIILVTSRESLGILGEAIYPVPSLQLPNIEQLTGNFRNYESIHLFEERAQLARVDFLLTIENALAVAKICTHLDGIPLAIELAAARLSIFSPEQIEEHLQKSFSLLTMGNRTALPRHQTLRAAIDWSHDLLSPVEQTLFRRLSVFVNGWTLDAAQSICSDADIKSEAILDLLNQLCNKSLVIAEEKKSGMRYRILETIRQYAREKLVAAGEKEWTHARHLSYFCQLAEQSYARIWGGPEQLKWLLQLDQETGNLEVAIKWGCQQRQVQAVEKTLHLIGDLYSYLWYRGRIVEGLLWAESVLEAADDLPVHPAALGKALLVAGSLAFFHAPMVRAETYIKAGLAANRAAGELVGISHALLFSGLIAANRNELVRAETLFTEGLQIARKIDSGWLIEYFLQNLAELAWGQGSIQQAYDLYSDALEASKKLEDRLGRFNVLIGLGRLSLKLGKLSKAATYSWESLTLSLELDSQRERARALRLQADLAFEQGSNDEARVLIEESLSIGWKIRDYRIVLFTLEDLAFVLSKREQANYAVRLLTACQAAYLHFGLQRLPDSEKKVTSSLEHLQLELDSSSFQQALEDGQKMSLDEALGLALKAVEEMD
jgi:predicted ATPase